MAIFNIPIFFFVTEPGSTPRNLSARPLSASTMVIQWDEPQELSGLVTVSSFTTIYIYVLHCGPSMTSWEILLL